MRRKIIISLLGCLSVVGGVTLGLAAAADAADLNPLNLVVQYPNAKYRSGTAVKGNTRIGAFLEAVGKTTNDPGRIYGGASTNNNFSARYDFTGDYACTNMAARAAFPNGDTNVYGFGGSVSVNCTGGAQPGGARVFLTIR
jgi:hypothetical protein